MKSLVMIGIVTLALLFIGTPVWAVSNTLTWTDNSDNETTFHVERKADACGAPAAFVEIATVPAALGMGSLVFFTDSAVVEGSTYCYRVAASNAAGKSGYSNEAGRTVPFSIPAAPSGLGVSGGL